MGLSRWARLENQPRATLDAMNRRWAFNGTSFGVGYIVNKGAMITLHLVRTDNLGRRAVCNSRRDAVVLPSLATDAVDCLKCHGVLVAEGQVNECEPPQGDEQDG